MMKRIKQLLVLLLIAGGFLGMAEAVRGDDSDDVLHSQTEVYGRVSDGIQKSSVPSTLDFGDILYDWEAQDKSGNCAQSYVQFNDCRGFFVSSGNSGFDIDDDEVSVLGVSEDGLPQVTATAENVPEWLQSATIHLTATPSSILGTTEGTLPLNGEAGEPFNFVGTIPERSENNIHSRSEETGYFSTTSYTRNVALTKAELNLPAGLDVPVGHPRINFKLKWDVAYTP